MLVCLAIAGLVLIRYEPATGIMARADFSRKSLLFIFYFL